MIDFAAARRHMVDGQLRTFDITDLRVLTAMDEVPRERFVAPAMAAVAYLDMTLPAAEGCSRRLLKPMVLGKMIQSVDLAATDRVLDIGCATGYGAAVLARIAAQVVALEEDPALVTRATAALAGETKITVVSGPLAAGWTAGAPYDAILVEGAVEVVPPALFQQLVEGGRLVCIEGGGPGAKATVYTRSGAEAGPRPVFDAFDAAVGVLPGFAKPPEFVF